MDHQSTQDEEARRGPNLVTSEKVVQDYIQDQLRKVAQASSIDTHKTIPTFWYTDERGNRWYPPEGQEYIHPPPEYVYHITRSPREVVERHVRYVRREDVDACSHEVTHPDDSWLPPREGRKCTQCRGWQTRNQGDPWPEGWNAGGIHSEYTTRTTYRPDLVLALVRPTAEEIERAKSRGYENEPIGFDQAVLLASISCERCSNALRWQVGLLGGYPARSEQWKSCPSRCDLCRI